MQTTQDNSNQVAPSETSILPASSDFVFGLLHWLRIARYRRKTIIQSLCVAAILGAFYYALRRATTRRRPNC